MLRLHPLELAGLEGTSPEETLVERARATGQAGFET
jgi:hypothetical protein